MSARTTVPLTFASSLASPTEFSNQARTPASERTAAHKPMIAMTPIAGVHCSPSSACTTDPAVALRSTPTGTVSTATKRSEARNALVIFSPRSPMRENPGNVTIVTGWASAQ